MAGGHGLYHMSDVNLLMPHAQHMQAGCRVANATCAVSDVEISQVTCKTLFAHATTTMLAHELKSRATEIVSGVACLIENLVEREGDTDPATDAEIRRAINSVGAAMRVVLEKLEMAGDLSLPD